APPHLSNPWNPASIPRAGRRGIPHSRDSSRLGRGPPLGSSTTTREVFMTARKLALLAGLLALVGALSAGLAWAGVFTASTLKKVSGASPFASCMADAGQTATNFPNTEVEPWV